MIGWSARNGATTEKGMPSSAIISRTIACFAGSMMWISLLSWALANMPLGLS